MSENLYPARLKQKSHSCTAVSNRNVFIASLNRSVDKSCVCVYVCRHRVLFSL